MTTDLFKSIYITMRIYTTMIQNKSITWNHTSEVLNAIKWATYCSEGYEYVSQTIYYEDFDHQCEKIRQYVSATDVPIDFIPNAYAYLLHAIFCKTSITQEHQRELALRIFSTCHPTSQANYSQLLEQIRIVINPQRAFSQANRCLVEALVTMTLCLPKHFDFLFDLFHDLNHYDQLCQLIIETIFKRSDLTSSYDCLISMKIEKLLEVLNEASFGAYVIVKIILKNRPSFIKGLKHSLAWHSQIFGKFSFVYANAVYEPIRPMLIDLCHDNEIQNVLMEDLF